MAKATVAPAQGDRTLQDSHSGLAFRREARALFQAASANLLVELEELLRRYTPEPSTPKGERGNGGALLLRSGRVVAEFLGVSEARFYELKRRSDFPTPVSLPGIDTSTRYFRRSDLERWVLSLQPAEGPPPEQAADDDPGREVTT